MPPKKRKAATTTGGTSATTTKAKGANGAASKVPATPPGQTNITAFFGGGGGGGGSAAASVPSAGAAATASAAAAAAAADTKKRKKAMEMVDLLTSEEDEGHDDEVEEEQQEVLLPVPQIDLSANEAQEQEETQALAEAMEELPEREAKGLAEEVSAVKTDQREEENEKKKKSATTTTTAAASSAPPTSPSPSAFFSAAGAASSKATASMTGSPVELPCDRYRPSSDACWPRGQPAPYLHLAWAFELLCSTTRRLTKADVLVNMFRSLMDLAPEDVLPAVYLSSNKLASSFEGIDINVGASTVSAAVIQATGTSSEKMKQLYTELGDLGDVAQALRVKQRLLVTPEPLTVRGVYQTIIDMANMKGQGCEGRKRTMMVRLIRSCRGPEAKFLVRTLVQNLRTGATLTSVLAALAMAAVMHQAEREKEGGTEGGRGGGKAVMEARLKQAQVAVKECYNSCPDIPRIVKALVEGGVDVMQKACEVAVGTPVKPMLAKICSGIPELMEKYGSEPFTCEYKYDGQRAQVHLLSDGSVKVFNRHIEDMTDKYPDVAQLMRDLQQALRSSPPSSSSLPPSSSSSFEEPLVDVILDTELAAVDRAQGNKLLAFQTLSTRGRKDVTAEGVTVQICVFAFDLLFLNGQSRLKEPLSSRRALLYSLFKAVVEERRDGEKEGGREGGFEGRFEFATHVETSDPERVQEFFTEALEAGCEGLMCKSLSHEYEPSKRTDSWLKVKKDYIKGLHDTLDLVPIGAWYGNGRKAGWFSPILLACYNPETEELQSLCRCMSGLTDAMYTELTKFYQSEGRIIEAPKSYVRTGETCPIWFEPFQVWEIRGAELTLSPVHKAGVGLVDKQKGMSLRFPRFLKMREDKGVEDATTAAQIAELFRMQIRRVEVEGDGDGGGKGGGGGKKKKEAEEEEGVEEEEEGWEDIL